MPLVAVDMETGKRLDLTGPNLSDDYLHSRPLACPICGNKMFYRSSYLRQGHQVRSHYAHLETCDANYDSQPESAYHLAGKRYLKEFLESKYQKLTDCEIELEVPIDMEWRDKGRIADICITFPMGYREAHEIQLSPITLRDLKQRTQDYRRAGCDVIWWLGEKANTLENRTFCHELFGACFYINFKS